MERIATTSQRLAELMAYYNITRSDLERKTGIGRSALSRYISGEREPRQDKIAGVALAYGVDAGWLMGLDVPMFSRKEDPVIVTPRPNCDSVPSARRAALYQAALQVQDDNIEVAIQLLKSLS